MKEKGLYSFLRLAILEVDDIFCDFLYENTFVFTDSSYQWDILSVSSEHTYRRETTLQIYTFI